MEKPIRVLIVDDSVVIRKLLTETLAEDPEISVVGTASNGRIALSKIEQLAPDLITLDIEMPVMDGLEALAEVRKLHPKLPVLMFSTLTERGATATLEALSLGASDYATKPSNTGSASVAIAAVRTELLPKIRALSGKKTARRALPGSLPRRVRPPETRVEIVAIGTSTGGPNALAEVIPRIPIDFPVPIVIVQHMPPVFTKALAERLANRSTIPVAEGLPGEILRPGRAWIAPGDFHMTVARAGVNWRLELSQGPPENSCRPAVDVLFRSVASVCRSNVLGVVMTGMGADGVIGAEKIREAGGEVIIQDEATAVVWGMPGGVYAAGLADAVYPLNRLAEEITRRVQIGRTQERATEDVLARDRFDGGRADQRGAEQRPSAGMAAAGGAAK